MVGHGLSVELHDEDDEEELTEAEIAEIKKKLAELGDTEEFDDDVGAGW